MEKYPFIHQEHQTYKNTFLQNVMISIRFAEKEDDFFDRNFETKLCDYLKTMFGFDKGLKKVDFVKQGFTLTSKSSDVMLSFQNGLIEAKIGCNSYTGFINAFSPFFTRFKFFLKNVMDTCELDHIKERKVNIWQFENKDKIDYKQVAQMVFSRNLNSKESNSDIDSETESLIKKKIRWEFDYKDKSYKALVRTGFLNVKENFYHLVLDSIVVKDDKTIKVDDMDEEYIKINDILFDAYHWAVSEQTKYLMNKAMED